jgi:cbb3-type cytochrome oxidase maturation protein
MSVMVILIPLALLAAASAVVAFVRATREGQFDDLDSPPLRMLDDDTPRTPRNHRSL